MANKQLQICKAIDRAIATVRAELAPSGIELDAVEVLAYERKKGIWARAWKRSIYLDAARLKVDAVQASREVKA